MKFYQVSQAGLRDVTKAALFLETMMSTILVLGFYFVVSEHQTIQDYARFWVGMQICVACMLPAAVRVVQLKAQYKEYLKFCRTMSPAYLFAEGFITAVIKEGDKQDQFC